MWIVRVRGGTGLVVWLSIASFLAEKTNIIWTYLSDRGADVIIWDVIVPVELLIKYIIDVE